MLRVILLSLSLAINIFRVAFDVYKNMKRLLLVLILLVVIDVSQCVGFAPGIYCGYENCYDGKL